MTGLRVTTSNGTVDTITLVRGRLRYSTGRAKQIVEGLRGANPLASDVVLFREMAGWSNGYVSFLVID